MVERATAKSTARMTETALELRGQGAGSGEGFWDEYLAAPPAMHVTCQN
jgi:hypothetical protein